MELIPDIYNLDNFNRVFEDDFIESIILRYDNYELDVFKNGIWINCNNLIILHYGTFCFELFQHKYDCDIINIQSSSRIVISNGAGDRQALNKNERTSFKINTHNLILLHCLSKEIIHIDIYKNSNIYKKTTVSPDFTSAWFAITDQLIEISNLVYLMKGFIVKADSEKITKIHFNNIKFIKDIHCNIITCNICVADKHIIGTTLIKKFTLNDNENVYLYLYEYIKLNNKKIYINKFDNNIYKYSYINKLIISSIIESKCVIKAACLVYIKNEYIPARRSIYMFK